jgi:hypothetical protein
VSSRPIVHITWPEDRPGKVEASVHAPGMLRDVAEAVMARIAEHRHIVMTGAVTYPLGEPWDPRRLEYVAFVELESGYALLWHHHFAYAADTWPTSSSIDGSRS